MANNRHLMVFQMIITLQSNRYLVFDLSRRQKTFFSTNSACWTYFFSRRYNLLRSRYTHLRLYSDGGQLREPLIEDETEDE